MTYNLQDKQEFGKIKGRNCFKFANTDLGFVLFSPKGVSWLGMYLDSGVNKRVLYGFEIRVTYEGQRQPGGLTFHSEYSSTSSPTPSNF